MRLLDELESVAESEAEQHAFVVRLVAHVENRTQIALSHEQRDALALELTHLRETPQVLIQMAENVIRSTDRYGRMDISLWLNSVQTYTGTEIGRKVDEIQRRRIEKLRELKYTDEEIENAGLVQLESVYRRRLQEEVDKRNEALKARVKACERFVRTGSDDVKRDIVEIALKKKLIDENEPFPEKIVHYFAPKLMKEIEAYQKRMKA